MSNILIRKVEESDLSAIEKLSLELIRATESQGSFNINVVSENFQSLLKLHDHYILVAESDGVVIGYINFSVRKTILHPGLSGLIDEIIVNKYYRGLGVGKSLINAVAEKCKELGCCELEVSTEITNSNSRRFYKKCGFDEMGIFLEMDL